jgi:hypothetical protein
MPRLRWQGIMMAVVKTIAERKNGIRKQKVIV